MSDSGSLPILNLKQVTHLLECRHLVGRLWNLLHGPGSSHVHLPSLFHYSNSSPTHPVEPVPLGSDVSVRGRWLAGGPSGSVAMLSLLSLTHSTCSPQPLSRTPSSGCTATASHSSAGSSPASRVSILELGSRLALGPVGPWLCPQESPPCGFPFSQLMV